MVDNFDEMCTGATGNYYLDRSSIGPYGHFYNSSNDLCPERRININNMTTLYKTIASKYRILAPSPRGQLCYSLCLCFICIVGRDGP